MPCVACAVRTSLRLCVDSFRTILYFFVLTVDQTELQSHLGSVSRKFSQTSFYERFLTNERTNVKKSKTDKNNNNNNEEIKTVSM